MGAGEYVRGDAHTQGIESFWAVLKRTYKGTHHCLSPKHLERYVRAIAGKHNIRPLPILARMERMMGQLVGRRLPYRRLVAPNGLASGARPVAFRHRPGYAVSWGA